MAIGLLLTAFVIALDSAGKLDWLDRTFYDLRVRVCQFFHKAPTDRLVHVDIDDGALETLGRWPWPRRVLADVLDELKAAGVKAVAFDVIFSERQAPTRDDAGVAGKVWPAKVTDLVVQAFQPAQWE